MCEDCDFEIYESTTQSITLRLEIREVMNGMMSRFYELMDETAEWQKEDQDARMSAWIELARRANGPIRRQGVEEVMATLQKSKEDEAIQKREAERAAEELVDQRNKAYANWLASGGLDETDDDELDEAKEYLEEGNLPMTTDDCLRELAPYGITHLLLGASPKKRRRH